MSAALTPDGENPRLVLAAMSRLSGHNSRHGIVSEGASGKLQTITSAEKNQRGGW